MQLTRRYYSVSHQFTSSTRISNIHFVLVELVQIQDLQQVMTLMVRVLVKESDIKVSATVTETATRINVGKVLHREFPIAIHYFLQNLFSKRQCIRQASMQSIFLLLNLVLLPQSNLEKKVNIGQLPTQHHYIPLNDLITRQISTPGPQFQ